MSVRFVVVADTRRGVVQPPELLDAENAALALSAWRREVSLDCRVHWERGYGLKALARLDVEISRKGA